MQVLEILEKLVLNLGMFPRRAIEEAVAKKKITP